MSESIKIFCVTDKIIFNLENSNLILAGVGKEKFNENYIDTSTKENIFYKEKYYSELSFHYWYWKNMINFEKNNWVGFCQKRRFWIKKESENLEINSNNLFDHLLVSPETSWKDYDAIICKPISVAGSKKVKLFKRGWKNIIENPALLFDKKNETIKVHFDMHHGYGNLDKAINLLEESDKDDFKKYVNSFNFYNPHIMFIARPKIINIWFSKLFPWLEKCEKIFGFKELKGYETTRIYAYLAERYLSFWFKKYSKYKEHPWIFVDQ